MDERIDLVVIAEEKPRSAGISLAIAVSFVLHTALLIFFIRAYRNAPRAARDLPIARYVQLMTQNPQDFVEAPGTKLERAPSLNAPLSDGNRKAAMPEPAGNQPTKRPGDGSGLFTPPMSRAPRAAQETASQQAQPATQPSTNAAASSSQITKIDTDRLLFRDTNKASAASGVDWSSAIREVSKVASLGGDGIDLGQAGGGEKGFAEQGPLSFETQWYDWGDYAQSMVSRIRVNWYANMPQLIRTGMKGSLTIRFTIQRDGRITDVVILKDSGVPPYDYAAKKAIELSSPLNPLPKDFPKASERVTCMFFYNMEVPE